MVPKFNYLRLDFLFISLLISACSTTDVDSDSSNDIPSQASSIPLLEPGFTLGTTFYGSADLPNINTRERTLIETAAEHGLTGFTYYIDWADLEPSENNYTLDEFRERLSDLQDLGIRTFVNITVGDIEEYNLPEQLSDGNGGIAEGISLDDAEVIERFGRLLDEVVPIILEYDGFVLGVGNEVDARLDNEYSEERRAYVEFVDAARERVHAIAPELAVGITLTKHAVLRRTETFLAMREVADVVPFNYAPIKDDFFVLDVDEIRADFKNSISAYGEGPILIQELTCPSAISMGASETWQADCFQELFNEIDTASNIRFASVFTFQDFDENTCNLVRELLFGTELDDLPEDIANRLADYLCQLGVIDPDGNPKAAWEIVIGAPEAISD